MKVLLVDDSEVILRLQTHLLTRFGCEVTACDSGAQALRLISQQPFELVVMDMQMPQMDGLQTTQKIRQAGVSVPIVALTGNDTEQDRQACYQAGMNGFLVKPISQAAFTAILTQLGFE